MGVTGRARASWVAALAATSVLAFAPAAQADEGLATGATSRYVLDAKRTTVEASITIELRNVTPDRGDTYYFYNEFSVPVPAGAEKARARSNGTTLPVSLRRTEDDSTRLARISFPNLLFGRTRTIELTFEVPGEAPRSKDSTRVGRGYASFAVYGVGDAGRNTVEVVAPSSMSFDATSEAFTASEKGSTTTHTASTSDPDGGFFAVVSLRDPDQADERTVEVAGTTLVLRGFRDDPRWSEFVADRVTAGSPCSRSSSAPRGPGARADPRGHGALGLRLRRLVDPSDDEIVVGEQVDADLISTSSRTRGSRATASPSAGVQGPGPGRRRAGRRGHGRQGPQPPLGEPVVRGRPAAQRVGRLGRRPVGRHRGVRLSGVLPGHP